MRVRGLGDGDEDGGVSNVTRGEVFFTEEFEVLNLRELVGSIPEIPTMLSILGLSRSPSEPILGVLSGEALRLET